MAAVVAGGSRSAAAEAGRQVRIEANCSPYSHPMYVPLFLSQPLYQLMQTPQRPAGAVPPAAGMDSPALSGEGEGEGEGKVGSGSGGPGILGPVEADAEAHGGDGPTAPTGADEEKKLLTLLGENVGDDDVTTFEKLLDSLPSCRLVGDAVEMSREDWNKCENSLLVTSMFFDGLRR